MDFFLWNYHNRQNLFAGNDLARVLRWGPGYTGGEDPLNLLRDVIDAEEIKLDRWDTEAIWTGVAKTRNEKQNGTENRKSYIM